MQTNDSFFKFSLYRVVLFSGSALILVAVAILGPIIRIHYFPEGGAFRHLNGTLSVHHIDVSHGDAIAIRFPCNRVALIDSGDARHFQRVNRYLRRRVVGRNLRIDYLILTHPHMDHMGGMVQIMQNFDVGTFWRPIIRSRSSHDQDNTYLMDYTGGDQPTPEYARVIAAAHHYADEIRIMRAGEHFGTPYWQMFFHTPTLEGLPAALNNFATVNEISSIKTLRFGRQIFVFTGDAGFMAEGDFLMSQTARDMFYELDRDNYTVHLSVGHHGSNGSSSNRFLELIEPTTAVISIGNHQHLPHPTAVGRIRRHVPQANLFITRDLGNIAMRTCGETWVVFTGFRNPLNLWWLFGILVVALAFVCFFHWERKLATTT